MYVFVLITMFSGHAVIPEPLPRFDTEQQCHAFGDPLLEKLRKRWGAVVGQCVKLRERIEGIPS
ncbi:hypothetical protein GCM10007874_10010 [Labrys miyagiensis]|uniref:Uncharacterized protein n=1 Tax=Labrys miyagiensis TaxID=346912 RepID=A0ABQ6CDI5_9HYPH|nr:hypothetical protein [Labrys miyagiensis]GLS17985.1 hypothetical protein GCM10007874_10010 [Labrys miyagiensis]